MPEFTQGKWVIRIPVIESQRLIIDCELPTRGEQRFHRSICRTFGYCDTLEEERSNAFLIAAAPAMYEALKEIYQYLEPDLCKLPDSIRNKMSKALKKAEGK